MAVNTSGVAPGIYFSIQDLSEYARTVPSSIGFIPIVSEYGPDNQWIFTNAQDFYLDFGKPDINYGGKRFAEGKYVADRFLKGSDALYVIRVGASDSAFSNMVIKGVNFPTGSYGDDNPDTTGDVSVSSVSGLNNEVELDALFASSPSYLDATPDTCVVFYGVGRGEWYDRFKIKISQHRNVAKRAEGVYILDIYQRQEDDEYDPDTESFSATYGLIYTFEVSFNPDMMDDSQESMFIEDVVNNHCRYIKCKADRDTCRDYNADGYDWSVPFAAYTQGIALENGDDGSIFDTTSANFATSLLSLAYEGTLPRIWNVSAGTLASAVIDEVHNTDLYYFNIVLDGGYETSVKDSIVTLVRDLRQDCVALIDNGDNMSASEALTSRANDQNYNDFHTALYEQYTKIRDAYTGQDIWVTPIYHMATVITRNDRVADIHSAPAGFNRGMVDNIKEYRYTPTPSYRDLFYLDQINPIVRFSIGDVVYGQLTTQRRPTALQDLNIVRLVLYIKRALEDFCRYYLWEKNDSDTWNAISNEINNFLKGIQLKRGLYDYTVEVGATEYEIKAKKIHVNVTLNPTRVVERIYLNFYIK